jgi:hypothetical protein
MSKRSEQQSLITYIEALAKIVERVGRQVILYDHHSYWSLQVMWPIGKRDLGQYVAVKTARFNCGPYCLFLTCGSKKWIDLGGECQWQYYLVSEMPRRWRSNLGTSGRSIHNGLEELILSVSRDLGYYFDGAYLEPGFLHRG